MNAFSVHSESTLQLFSVGMIYFHNWHDRTITAYKVPSISQQFYRGRTIDVGTKDASSLKYLHDFHDTIISDGLITHIYVCLGFSPILTMYLAQV